MFYSKYNPKKLEKGTSFKGHKEVANQQVADDVDISKLIKTYIEDGPIDMPVVRDLQFGDNTITYADYQQYKDVIKQVADDWYSLPKETQRQFGSIDKYVDTLSQAYNGNVSMQEKLQKSNIAMSPVKSADVSACPTSSSSLSAGDSKIQEEVTNGAN